MKPANKRFLIVMSVIVVILLGWWAWSYFGPKPLGDRLEYIGRKDYGSWLPLSSSSPTGVYYYATDMSVEEVGRYFKKGSLLKEPFEFHTTIPSTVLKLQNNSSQKGFFVSYYINADAVVAQNSLHSTSKKHIVTVESPYYDTAMGSL